MVWGGWGQVFLVGQASQSITYQLWHNVLTSLLRDPRKLTSILKEESDSLVQKNNKLFGPNFEEHLHKKAKLKTESRKLVSKINYNEHGNKKPFSSDPPPNARSEGRSLTLFRISSSNNAARKSGYKKGKDLTKVLGENLPQRFLESDEKSAGNTFSRINHKFGLRKSN